MAPPAPALPDITTLSLQGPGSGKTSFASANDQSFPLEIRPVETEMNRKLLNDFSGERTGFVQVGPDKWFLPAKYAQHAANLYNLPIRKDDTWVVTFPRSGTTWSQELVWLVANDLDYEGASRVPQVERFPFLEFHLFLHDSLKQELMTENMGDERKQAMVEEMSRPGHEMLAQAPGPRFIKTHLPFSLLPPNLLDTCKVVYVARNPKDVAVSFYHLNRLIRTQGYQGDFPKYWDYFERGLHPWTPYWKHVKEGWERRSHPNFLFLFYEDMNMDLKGTIRKVGHFLEKELNDDQVSRLSEHLNIKNFRNNSAVNYDVVREVGMMNEGEQAFIRRGKTGGWNDEFSPELSERADKWITENLQNTDLRFPQDSWTTCSSDKS